MKYYYILYTTVSETGSVNQRISENLEELEKEVPNYCNWYDVKGSCYIRKIDEKFQTQELRHYRNGKVDSIDIYN